jgi:hypothetical protein
MSERNIQKPPKGKMAWVIFSIQRKMILVIIAFWSTRAAASLEK